MKGKEVGRTKGNKGQGSEDKGRQRYKIGRGRVAQRVIKGREGKIRVYKVK